MTYRTVICAKCGWAAFAVSRTEAERQVEEFRAFYEASDEVTRARFNPPRGLDSYACQQCGGSSFRPEAEDDRIPAGVTLAPVICDHEP
jgi:ribosomal protein L37E